MDSDEDDDLEIKDIPNVLKKIPNTFHSTQFAPRPVVLDIMRNSNVQKELHSLEDHCKVMDSAMSSVVNSYYQGFNKSIRSYSQILGYITDSQHKVDSLKVDLEKAKALLICRNQDLKIMWKKVLEYHYMLQILEKIEDLETVPQRLAGYIATNHFLHASELLVKSVKTIFGEDLLKVGALAELRQSLLEQRNLFHEVLIEKLHSNVYVKDSNNNIALLDLDDHAPASLNSSMGPTRGNSLKLESDPRKLLERASSKADFNVKMDAENFDEEILEDLTTDPSQNPKQFMRLLVEALNALGQLNSAVSIINTKISPEMKKVIQLITKKVVRTHESRPTLESAERAPLLVDLTNAIFDKCIRIMHNHIQMATMFNGVFSRKNGKRAASGTIGNYSVEHVWEIVQKEIREMLKGYLGDSQTSGTVLMSGSNGIAAHNEEKKLFTFANSSASLKDTKSTAPIPSSSASVLHAPAIQSSPYNITSVYPAVIRFDEQVLRLMNTHVKGFSNQSYKPVLRNYMDDFIQRAFLQHIKTDYSKRVHNSIEGPEAFKCVNKPLVRDSSRPLLHSIIDIYQLIRELVIDVTAMPQYASEFVAIMDSILARYFDKCVAKMDSELRDILSGSLIYNNNDYVTVLTSDPLWKTIKMFSHKSRRGSISGSTASGGGSSHGGMDEVEEDWTQNEEEEYQVEAYAFYGVNAHQTGQVISAVSRSQLITELPKLALFASLSDSLDWLATRLCEVTKEISTSHVPGMNPLKAPIRNLRQSSRPRSGNYSGGNSLSSSTGALPTPGSPLSSSSSFVPANSVMAEALDRVNQKLEVVAKQFNSLADRALLILRSEFRIQCMFYMEGLKRTSYIVEETRQEPDVFISELNASLSSVEETMAHHLPPIKTRFLFDRLAALIARLLIKGLASIKGINKNGVFKMFRNVFALQQNLTNIIVRKEQHFDRVRKYYELLNLSEEELLASLGDMIAAATPASAFARIPMHSPLHEPSSSNRAPLFSADEYRTVVEVQKYNKRVSASVATAIEQKLKTLA